MRASEWYRKLRRFEQRSVVGEGQVVGARYPALLSERDCVINFARFLSRGRRAVARPRMSRYAQASSGQPTLKVAWPSSCP
jgi:hypothetical protein